MKKQSKCLRCGMNKENPDNDYCFYCGEIMYKKLEMLDGRSLDEYEKDVRKRFNSYEKPKK